MIVIQQKMISKLSKYKYLRQKSFFSFLGGSAQNYVFLWCMYPKFHFFKTFWKFLGRFRGKIIVYLVMFLTHEIIYLVMKEACDFVGI